MMLCNRSKISLRDRWIWLTALLNVSITQYMLGMYAVVPHGLNAKPKLAVEPGGMLLNSLLFFPITYYFSYFKRGTLWLGFTLVAGPIAMVLFTLKQGSKEIDGVGSTLFYLGMTLNVLLYIPWYSLSLKVLQLNRRDDSDS